MVDVRRQVRAVVVLGDQAGWNQAGREGDRYGLYQACLGRGGGCFHCRALLPWHRFMCTLSCQQAGPGPHITAPHAVLLSLRARPLPPPLVCHLLFSPTLQVRFQGTQQLAGILAAPQQEHSGARALLRGPAG